MQISKQLDTKMWGIYGLLLFVSSNALVSSGEEDVPYVEPQHLDHLLAAGEYEELGRLLGVDNVDLLKPHVGESEHPMMNKELEFGDILPYPARSEGARQGLRFDRYPSMKWGEEVPYWIYNFTQEQVQRIVQGIDLWNRQVAWLKWRPWQNGDNDYVAIINGGGCYAYMGKIGGQQVMSLHANGCLHNGIILHEMMHTVGFHHEQCRTDRDDYIRMLWHNIPEGWRSQYNKMNPDHFQLHGDYDYRSIMHYGVNAPETNLPAFEVLDPNMKGRENEIGNRPMFTQSDRQRLWHVYGRW